MRITSALQLLASNFKYFPGKFNVSVDSSEINLLITDIHVDVDSKRLQ